GCQLMRGSDVHFTIQDMADLVRVFLMHAGQRKLCEAFRRHGIERGRFIFRKDIDEREEANGNGRFQSHQNLAFAARHTDSCIRVTLREVQSWLCLAPLNASQPTGINPNETCLTKSRASRTLSMSSAFSGALPSRKA